MSQVWGAAPRASPRARTSAQEQSHRPWARYVQRAPPRVVIPPSTPPTLNPKKTSSRHPLRKKKHSHFPPLPSPTLNIDLTPLTPARPTPNTTLQDLGAGGAGAGRGRGVPMGAGRGGGAPAGGDGANPNNFDEFNGGDAGIFGGGGEVGLRVGPYWVSSTEPPCSVCHSTPRGVSDWSRGSYWLSSTEPCFDAQQ
jgi:hypothetical protein